MKELLNIEWLNTLGWTFVHSVWQALLIFILVFGILRLVPRSNAARRYAIACAGLFIFAAVAIGTFVYLGHPVGDNPHENQRSVAVPVTVTASDPAANAFAFESIAAMIDRYMPWFLALWAAGFLFFSARLGAALMMTQRISSSAIQVTHEWDSFLRDAADKLGIRKAVRLAETAAVHTPVVAGYFKPVILMPVGMFTGLTTEQLETVLLHELAHIRRNDYLVNLVQSVIEAIFFFNPFVWMMSGIVRKEREYCCDDMVVASQGTAGPYAHALVKLAEAALPYRGFALSVAGEKKQLFARIRRMMEKPTDTRKSRIILPAFLLIAALMCISWLGGRQQQEAPAAAAAAPDTIPEDRRGQAFYSRKSIITIGEDGKPHEEVVETFEGDESLRPLMGLDESTDAAPALPHGLLPDSSMDTIPPHAWQGAMAEWQARVRAMQEELARELRQFHLKSDSLWSQGLAERFETFTLPDEALRKLERFESGEAVKHLEEELKRLRELEFPRLREHRDRFTFPDHGGTYEDALRNELRKDGYLKEGESIESLEWSNDYFKVNGKSIRKEHQDKYRRFFGGGSK